VVNNKSDELNAEIQKLVEFYGRNIVSGRSRKVRLIGRKCSPKILRSFLGYEIQAGRKRITCPDMVTARYLKIFAEIGVQEILIPYDPTRTSIALPCLEKHFEKILAWIDRNVPPEKKKAALRAAFRKIRTVLSKRSSV